MVEGFVERVIFYSLCRRRKKRSKNQNEHFAPEIPRALYINTIITSSVKWPLSMNKESKPSASRLMKGWGPLGTIVMNFNS